MDNTLNSPAVAQSAASAAYPSRRAFMRYLTAGAAVLAVEGCGGGGASSTTPPVAVVPAPVPVPPPAPVPVPPVDVPPAPVAPVWLSIPTIAFTQGTPSSFSVADYISVANAAAFTLTLNATPLPSGVTFNSANRSFDYDGRGGVAATDGHILTAIGA